MILNTLILLTAIFMLIQIELNTLLKEFAQEFLVLNFLFKQEVTK